MIGYAVVGSNRMEEAKAFYDALIPLLGGGPLFDHFSGGRIYGKESPAFGVVGTFDGQPADPGNGMMIAFLAESTATVREVHEAAIRLGGSDKGAPGWRGEPGGFYGAYFRDLDGNKLCVYRTGPE
jgi:catechol 2,3-dioxygenase-like lactoylglutathione lyase family enzyme